MTATQMYDEFLLAVNASNNMLFRSYEVAAYLNRAQQEVLNKYFYPNETKRGTNTKPIDGFEDSIFSSEIFSALIIPLTGTTSPYGFFQSPADMLYPINSLYIVTNDGCDPGDERYELIRFMRQFEIAASSRNYFERPRKLSANYLMNNLRYHDEVLSSGEIGFRILPKDKYTFLFRYIKTPPTIAIQNPTWESTLYSANPDYVAVASDTNCVLPEYIQWEIIQRAVATFNRSAPNPQQYTLEQQKASSSDL